VQHFQLSFRFLQLLKFASLLKDCMCLHQVVSGILRVPCNDEQSTNNFQCLGKLGAGLSIQDSFKVFNLPKLLQRLLKLVPSQVDKGDISLNFACTDVLESIVSLVDRDGLLQILESVIDLPALLLPSAKLGRDAGQVIRACELFKLFKYTQSLLLIVDRLFDVSFLRVNLGHLQVSVRSLLTL